MNRGLALIIIVFCMVLSAASVAQSPYENRLLSGDRQRVGLVAYADVKDSARLLEQANGLEQQYGVMQQLQIFKLSIFFRTLKDRVMVFAYFETPSKKISGWEKLVSQSSEEFREFSTLLKPHDRAVSGTNWLKMEWINLVASEQVFPFDVAQSKKMGLMSGLKPELELNYRSLHQANWPGVVDGMVNSNYRNWTTFMVEDKDELFLFTYSEYIGTDIAGDNKIMAADPTTQRWWQHTEKSLINLHGEGNWSLMKPANNK